jgi:hypothetical protein
MSSRFGLVTSTGENRMRSCWLGLGWGPQSALWYLGLSWEEVKAGEALAETLQVQLGFEAGVVLPGRVGWRSPKALLVKFVGQGGEEAPHGSKESPSQDDQSLLNASGT